MPEIGSFNKLTVIKKTTYGVYLDGHELGEILLPHKHVPEKCKQGDCVDAFLYLNAQGDISATTKRPHALVGEYALMTVVSVVDIGAFLDWGLPKDLLVPISEQKQPMVEGMSYIVYVFRDKRTNRIAASSNIDRYLDQQPAEYRELQAVDLMIAYETDLGYRAIINNAHWGVLYKNEVFQPLQRGQRMQGFIKKMRPDDKIDLCLQKPGYSGTDAIAEKIMQALKDNNGFIPVTDKSAPETIYAMFGISKKSFKKAIGGLYKKRLLIISSEGISLTDD
ncbi:MAG: GntR family transcriptional regulator [Deltaproteobacteria bacterium]|nr:GntR family transcriptional regulator [Deltaproteobacteria bacterium]